LDKYDNDIEWVIAEFGDLSAAELELASTIVYIDREGTTEITTTELARRVQEVKPHFSLDRIISRIQALTAKELLRSR
jgi:hypothetical protein